MKPDRLHRRPDRSARSPRWARKKCRGPHSGHQCQHKWGSLAGERTGRQCRVPTRRKKRHTLATRHRPLASLTRNLRDQVRTPSVRTVSTDPQPQIARAPPPWRARHFAQTQARRGGRRSEIHREPARGPRPGKPHLTRPNTRLRGEHHLTDTTATTILSMPSWSPAGPTQSQHRRRRASTWSRDTTRRKTHPSRHRDEHTSSPITPPWSRLPLRVRGRRARRPRRGCVRGSGHEHR